MNIIKQKNISQLSTFGIGGKAEYYTNLKAKRTLFVLQLN